MSEQTNLTEKAISDSKNEMNHDMMLHSGGFVMAEEEDDDDGNFDLNQC